jgi:hypothetical protein
VAQIANKPISYQAQSFYPQYFYQPIYTPVIMVPRWTSDSQLLLKKRKLQYVESLLWQEDSAKNKCQKVEKVEECIEQDNIKVKENKPETQLVEPVIDS